VHGVRGKSLFHEPCIVADLYLRFSHRTRVRAYRRRITISVCSLSEVLRGKSKYVLSSLPSIVFDAKVDVSH
jgi:hypothetical protein